MRMMRASVVSCAALVVAISSAPSPLIVPANTSDPSVIVTGTLSPVIGAWFTSLAPATTRPSSGILSPGRTMTCVPTGTSATGSSRSAPSGYFTRAIGGASSGGICAFTVAWNRPDLFGRVCSQIGSFTNIRGGDAYPDLIRGAPKKPIKVFLADGTNDLINEHGDWWQANEAMAAALRQKGYAFDFLQDRGFHAYWTCGKQLPEALRRTWAGAQ